jgi:hypothetical protein
MAVFTIMEGDGMEAVGVEDLTVGAPVAGQTVVGDRFTFSVAWP